MSRATLLIFSLLALACTFAVADTTENSWETFGSSGNAPSDDSWDFFVLAQQWPGGFPDGTWPACTSTFTLHGLWPTRNDSTWPSDCSNIAFNVNKLGNLLSTMNCQWPSSNGDQTQFWSHEWSTHGTCAHSDPTTATEYEFFSTALLVHSNADVYHALSAANILPSDSQEYSVSSIGNAVNSALGVVPILGCSDHRLTTLQICVDKSLSFIPCPEGMSDDSCGSGTVWYNTIKHSN